MRRAKSSVFGLEGFDEDDESVEAVLEQIGEAVGLAPAEIVGNFLASSESLTPDEQAELLGEMVEAARSAPTSTKSGASTGSSNAPRVSGGSTSTAKAASSPTPRPTATPGGSGSAGRTSGAGTSGTRSDSGSSGFDLGRLWKGVTTYLPQAISYAQQGAQLIQQFTPPRQAAAPAQPQMPGPPPDVATAPQPTPSGDDGAAPTDVPAQPTPSYAPAGVLPPGMAAGAYPPASAYLPPGAYPPLGGGAPLGGFTPHGRFLPPAGSPPTGYPSPTGYGAPSPASFSGALGQVQQGYGQVANLLNTLRPGMVPSLPGQAFPGQPGPSPVTQTSPAGASTNATALLGLLLQSPYLGDALRKAAVLGPSGTRTMELPMPYGGPGGAQTARIPLAGVLAPFGQLIEQAMEELNANTNDSDPEMPAYLVDDDGRLIVDPNNADQRGALAIQMMRVSQQAARSGWFGNPPGAPESADAEAWRALGLDN